ncbi:MAG: hypothetical protein IPO44_00045 [Candidatus Microthrix sp.]|nr:hypothetical protein [Candidatus Microthrix sp.]MBK9558023.1 hypothetical protein [Candidatus Microthrix sp.]
MLFPDEAFADLFQATGAPVSATEDCCGGDGVATVLGMSDREAVSAFQFDARWKYACGGLDF